MDENRKASSELLNDREQAPPGNNTSLAPGMEPEPYFASEGSSPSSQGSVHTEANDYALEFQPDGSEQYSDYLRMYASPVSVDGGYLPSSPNLCALTSAQAMLARFVFDCWEDQPNLYMPVPEGSGPSKQVVDSRLGVGFCIGRFSTEDGKLVAYVDLIVVNPPYRKQGHARRLYREFFKRCLLKYTYTVIALVKKSDLSSHAFHKALGFEEGTLSDGSGYNQDQLAAMRKNLPG